jgi:hypothetical protein
MSRRPDSTDSVCRNLIDVVVEKKATQHNGTRALSADQLITPGQYPFA